MFDRIRGSSDHQINSTMANALQANIQKSGQNSYYYAHSDSSGGLRSTLGEAPRLLQVVPIQSSGIESPSIRPIVPISNFAWSDADKFVKIYIDFESASTILKEEDITVSLKNEGRGLEIRIVNESKNQVLLFKRERLHASVTAVKAKRFEKRVVVTLTKEDAEGTWFELESKGGVDDE